MVGNSGYVATRVFIVIRIVISFETLFGMTKHFLRSSHLFDHVSDCMISTVLLMLGFLLIFYRVLSLVQQRAPFKIDGLSNLLGGVVRYCTVFLLQSKRRQLSWGNSIRDLLRILIVHSG
jgi:hypothetical protein